jgi:hypothetical protein
VVAESLNKQSADHGDFFFAKVELFKALMLDFLRRQDVPARNRAP